MSGAHAEDGGARRVTVRVVVRVVVRMATLVRAFSVGRRRNQLATR